MRQFLYTESLNQNSYHPKIAYKTLLKIKAGAPARLVDLGSDGRS